ncbi:MAG: methyltransferase domain-containing protein [Bryobacterales bacterium]|nr:methyltransferase domain-containing protein [Bryobacterales bacterium]
MAALTEFTGERVVPGRVDPDLWNEHLARYSFAARLSRKKRVLDAGCGAGYGAAELARVAGRVVGIDVSQEAISFATANYQALNLRFLRSSCAALPFADHSFDLVVAFEVIEHIAEWPSLLDEARRLLAPGGQFIVSTPNKSYYTDTRRQSGPNPWHVHEFEFEEFRQALTAVFPHVSLFVENHAQGIVFKPVETGGPVEVRVEGGGPAPHESHFFLAVCASSPQTGAPTFIYLPSATNVLRERELHIQRLESELATKDQWIEALGTEKQELVEISRAQTAELEAKNRWAETLNRQLEETGDRVVQLQDELASEQRSAQATAEAYEAKVAELEQASREKTEWALETERRLGAEIEAIRQELAKCVELLDTAERTVEERTNWALSLDRRIQELEMQLGQVQASRWIRLGRVIGLGPELGKR